MFLINEGDDAFVGWALGSAALGVYQLSYRLSNAPATEITHPIQRVVFPAYSKVKDDVGVLRDGYFTSIRLITLLAFPASVGVALVAPVFVPAVLDSQWTGMIVPMQVLAAYAAVRSFRSATVPLFRAIDRPDYDTKIRVLKLVLLASAIYPASEAFGVTGVALALLGHTLVVAPIASYVAVRSVDGRMWTFARILSYPTFGSAVMGVAVYGVRRQLTGIHPVVELVVLVVVGALVYAGVILLLERQVGIGLDRIYRVVRKQAG